MSIKILFEFEKETKGAVRFKELSDDPAIGTLYIKKAKLKMLGITEKDTLTVSIESEEK